MTTGPSTSGPATMFTPENSEMERSTVLMSAPWTSIVIGWLDSMLPKSGVVISLVARVVFWASTISSPLGSVDSSVASGHAASGVSSFAGGLVHDGVVGVAAGVFAANSVSVAAGWLVASAGAGFASVAGAGSAVAAGVSPPMLAPITSGVWLNATSIESPRRVTL